MKKFILVLILGNLLLLSCTTSKNLSKKAKKLEDVSQYQSASELYFQAVRKNPNNIDAVTGMKRTGDRVLKSYLNKFSKAKLDQDYKRATYAFIDAVSYQKKIKTLNIDLPISDFQKEDFRLVRKKYLNQEYEKGLNAIDEERFSDAENSFNEIYKFDKDFKDVKDLRDIAYLEPIYREAEKAKENKEYRTAYQLYQNILNRVNNYKNSKKGLAYVLKKGRINIMILTKKVNYRYQVYTKSIESYTESSIINSRDPFIKLVDRENMQALLDEQDLSVSGLVNENQAVELGDLTGANYALSIEVTNFVYNETPLKTTTYTGFEKYREKFYNKQTEQTEYKVKYKRVKYFTHSASRMVNLTTHYKLISLKTGEILDSKIFDEYKHAELNYLTYNGNVKKLYPEKEGRINTSYTANKELVEWSENSRELATKSQLTNELYKIVSTKITNKLLNEFSK